MKKGLLGYYNYTVILTYMGMLFSFFGILRIIHRDFSGAIICLMVSGVCDMFDGMVAATKLRDESEKRFGIQIDSLSDLVSFGIFPAIFVYVCLDYSILAGVISSLYALAALIRLAYFNVLEEDRQKQTDGARKFYLGLPVTTITLLLPAAFLLYEYGIIHNKNLYLALLVVSMLAFLSKLSIKKPGVAGKIGMIVVGLAELTLVILLMKAVLLLN